MNLILAILLSVVSCFSLFNSFGVDATPALELTEFNTGLTRQFVILIENTDDGLIKVLTDAEEKVIGEVVSPVQRASSIPSRYWGAHYIGACNGSLGGIVYTGGDSIRIRCGPNRKYNLKRPRNWMPSGITIVPFTEEESAVDGDLVVSCPGGEDIFSKWSPYIGNPVYAMEHDGSWSTIDNYFSSTTRSAPEMIMIDVLRPDRKLEYIELENWIKGDVISGQKMEESGKLYVKWNGENRKVIGSVVQRAFAHDQIVGTEYAEVSQISSVAPGEVVLSTSHWYGQIDEEEENLRSGVRIIPINHAKYLRNDPELTDYIRDGSTIIVGAMGVEPIDLGTKEIMDGNELRNPPIMGLPPLFNGFIRPRFEQSDYSSSFHYYISDDFGRSWRSTSQIIDQLDEDGTSRVKYWTNIRIFIGR